MKKSHTPIALVLFTFVLLIFSAPPTFGEGLPLLGAAALSADESASQRDAAYRDGRKALDDERWNAAASHFDSVITKGGKDADAALYWKAYAHHKAGERAAALAALSQLDSKHTQSRWRDDGRALRVEIQGGGGEAEMSDEDELKLLALNSLMHTDDDRAVEMIERFLTGDRSEKLRHRALFVLSQSPKEQARKILIEAAHGQRGDDLRRPAIRFLGMAGASDELQSIYAGASDPEIKQAVLKGYMMAGDSDRVLAIYRSENDPKIRRSAVHQLGVMGSHEVLRGLYRSESSPEVRGEILQSLFIAQDAEGLIQIINSETNEDLKKKAIRNLGLVQDDEARETLLKIYRGDGGMEIKKSVLQALFLNQAAADLIEIARSEKNPELRKHAIRNIGMIQSDEAIAFMMEILEGE